MNGYDENPENWQGIIWRMTYGNDLALLIWGVHLADALREANRNEPPTSVQFYDEYWLSCTQDGIRRAMREAARPKGMSESIAA